MLHNDNVERLEEKDLKRILFLKAYGIDPAQLDKPARVKEAIPNEQVVNVHANKLGKGNKNYSDGNIKSSKKKK